MNKPTIIMIDDEAFYLEFYQKVLEDEYDFIKATSLNTGVELIISKRPEVLLLDISLKLGDPDKEDRQGLSAIPRIRHQFPELPIIMVTGIDSALTLQQAQELGADDYFVKTDKISRLKELLKSYILPPAVYKAKDDKPIAVSPSMRRVLQLAKRFAASQEDILITGETGVGKEVIASYIHHHSDRVTKPFIPLNVAAIESNMLIAELVGHVKGAFTSATQSRTGLLKEAEGGMIFLDEIGDLATTDQVKLLRLIEDKMVRPIGANKEIKVDVRIITATHASLKEYVTQGKFRSDLYQRLAGCVIYIPPLREREEDIIPLAKHFLKQAAIRNKKQEKKLAYSALLQLKNHHWEGNVRELMNVMTNAFLNSPAREITASQLNLSLPQELSIQGYKPAKEQFERQFIKAAIDRGKGNQTAAAELIGISRQYLMKKMKAFGLDLNEWELED